MNTLNTLPPPKPPPPCEVAVLSRTRTAERYARGLTAAVVAVATLLLAANAGPARADAPRQDQRTVADSR
ncbi:MULTISPECIES: hypothetical protein [Streptomyces]|uniref:hypothetical protein n=1 Tax=Streptomyces TaxID=1883 RepID=UPI0035DA50C5